MRLLYIVIAILTCYSCKTKVERKIPLKEKITESVYASGIVKSKEQYQVFSSVNGLISDILVTKGDTVKKGEAIIILTNTTARLNTENAAIASGYAASAANSEKINELNISIEQAKIKAGNEALLYQRQKSLWDQQIGTRNELEQRELALKTAQNNYEASKLRLTELNKQISFQDRQSKKNLQISSSLVNDYIIKSERNGRVYNILKEKGEMVNTQTPVALIGNADSFMLELQVDEYDITKVKAGQKILLTMDSYKSQLFEAVITKINPAMNDRSKSFTVEAVFVKQPPALYPSLTCEANIVIQTKENVLTIPRNYLLDGDYVLMENNEKRKVTTGLKDYQKVEILNGLSAKDVIIKPAN